MIKSIADEIGGICITIEGGTLKEGEITGLPYQYKDEKGNIKFRFLPYYAIERIQEEEKRIFELKKNKKVHSLLEGDENKYSINDLSVEEKIKAIKDGDVKLVIIFIDEINRTENTVYKELMNILLTRSVNGYNFPWWVQFVGAMNPSTLNSIYATNEMDPAQLDRFIKIKVTDKADEWINYGKKAHISTSILDFIKDNPKCLSSSNKQLEDEEKPQPSPRGWEMIDILLSSEPKLRTFFSEKENDPKVVDKDMKELVAAKIGQTTATMYFTSLVNSTSAVEPEKIFKDDKNLTNVGSTIKALSVAKKNQTCDLMLDYLKENIEFMSLSKDKFKQDKEKLKKFISLLDSSTRLLFAQKLTNAKSNDGNSLFEMLYEIFDKDLIGMLDLSDKTKKLIENSK